MAGIHFTVTETGTPFKIQHLPENGELCVSVDQGVATAAKYAFGAIATFYTLAWAFPFVTVTALIGLFVPQLGQQMIEKADEFFKTEPHQHDGADCNQGKALQIALATAAGYLIPALGGIFVGQWLSEQANGAINSLSSMIDNNVENMRTDGDEAPAPETEVSEQS